MNIKDLAADPKLQKAATTFAAGYGKRMMAGQYDRLDNTAAVQKAKSMSRPKKLAIEAALNGLVAYLATKESEIAESPVKALLWEVAMDAPSEISKRLLNRDHAKGAASSNYGDGVDAGVAPEDEMTVTEDLIKMPAEELAVFLNWLQNATAEERRRMAETMSRLSEDEQIRLASISAEKAKKVLRPDSPEERPLQDIRKGILASLADSLRSVNEHLESRNRQP